MNTGARCAVHPGVALLGCLELGCPHCGFHGRLSNKENATNPVFATGFLVRLLRSALSWLAVLGAVLCWALFDAARCAALGGGAGFAEVPRARVSPLRFSWALIEQRKCNKPPLRNWLGSLAAIDLALARCARCNVVLSAVQCCALCSAGGGAGGKCTMLRTVQRCALCNDVRSEALGAVKRWALCSAGRCASLRTV